VRLAAKLTGWNIDVRSEAEKRREAEAAMGLALPEAVAEVGEAFPVVASTSSLLSELTVEGLDEAMAERLAQAGFPTTKSLFTATAEQLMQVEGMDQELSFRLIDAVQAHFGE
jgi:N utilization substance protein A